VSSNTIPKSAGASNVASSSNVVQLDLPQKDQVIGLAGLGDRIQEPRQSTQDSVSSSSRLHPKSRPLTTDTAKLDTMASRMLHRTPPDIDPSSSRRSSIVTLTPNQYGRSSIGNLPPVRTPLKQVQPERPIYLSSIPSRLYNPVSNFSRKEPEKELSPHRSDEQLRYPEPLKDLCRHSPLREPDQPPIHPSDAAWAKIDDEWATRNQTAQLRRRRINQMHTAQRDDVILEPSSHAQSHRHDPLKDNQTQSGLGPSDLSGSDPVTDMDHSTERSSLRAHVPVKSDKIIVLGNIGDTCRAHDVRAMFQSLGFAPISIKFRAYHPFLITHKYLFMWKYSTWDTGILFRALYFRQRFACCVR
jgi:hypothetical protein